MLLNLKKTTWLFALPVAALLLVGGAARSQAAVPAGTGFTYQGQLTSGGNPVNGNCDFQFGLWDAAADGAQIGEAQSLNSVSVTNGLFTVTLDFGATAFTGEARWLEIAVRCPSETGGHTTLSPRQALTAAPYAIHAQSAPWSGLSSVPAGFADGVDDNTAYSAGSGLSLSGTQFSVDSSAVQSRVSGNCAVGSSIRQISADGMVTCESDDDTTYSAGSGLTLSGNQFSISPGGITSTMIADNAITASHVLSSSVQLRVNGACVVGQYITAVKADGTVACGADADSGGDITAVNAGTGLTGGGATGAITVTVASGYQLPQSCAAGQVPVANGAGGWTCAANDTTPPGLVGFFMGGTCPAGWSEVTAARGRVIVGLPAGGTNQGTYGTALSNLGPRNVTLGIANLPAHTHDVDPAAVSTSMTGAHTHDVDPAAVTATTSTDGNHTHGWYQGSTGMGVNVYNAGGAGPYQSGSIAAAGAHNHTVTVDVGNTTSTSAGNHSHTVDIPNTVSSSTGSGMAFDTSMPYIQLIACSKN